MSAGGDASPLELLRAAWQRAARDPKLLFLLVFVGLLLRNATRLLDPPYWDALFGTHNQALWLCRHDFDLVRLWTSEPSYHGGGSFINDTCPLPYLYAVLYWFLPHETVYFVLHIFTLVLAAAVFVLFYRLLTDHVPPHVAFLWCLAATCDPIWSARCAAIYREVHVAACAAAAIYCLHKKQSVRAWVWIGIGYLVKETAAILGLAAAGWMVLTYARQHLSGHKWRLGKESLAALATSGLVGAVLVRYLYGQLVVRQRFVSFGDAVQLFPLYSRFFFPSLAVALVLILAFAVVTVLRPALRARFASEPDHTVFCLFLLAFVVGFWCAYTLYPEPAPRYASFIVFPMAALLALLTPRRQLSAGLAVVMIVWGVANQNGRLLPTIHANRSRSGDALERSREYLVDLDANRRICQTLEQECFTTPIVAKWPFVQMLTVPEFGYVSKPLPNVYAVGVRPLYTPTRAYDPETPMPPETLYIYAPNTFETWHLFAPRLKPATGDILVFAEESLPGSILIYSKPSEK